MRTAPEPPQRLRLAVWTPLPPQRSGIADYAFTLLTEMQREADVIAVVRDGSEGSARAPDGVQVVPKSQYRRFNADLDVYHFGNHARFHGYMYEPVLRQPGLLVLHDPALPDFHWDLCGGFDSALFAEEVRFDGGGEQVTTPICFADEAVRIDWTRRPLVRRLIEASRLTIVHSETARARLAGYYPRANIVHRNLAALVVGRRHTSRAIGGATFAVLGGISAPKRTVQVLAAFAQLHREDRTVRLVIAGRADQPEILTQLRLLVEEEGLEESVTLASDVSEERFESIMLDSDAVIVLRWPTVGETSRPLMQALGAGRVVICSDVPQARELEDRFCWRVATREEEEIPQLTEQMRRVAQDLSAARRAGEAARQFVQGQASFPLVASQHVALCRRLAETTAGARSRRSDSWPPAVNAIGAWESTSGIAEAGRRMVGALLEAGVTVALENVDFGYSTDPRRLPEGLRALPTGRPHATDLCFLNINEMNVLPAGYLERRWRDSRVIASWYWELPGFPPHLRCELDQVDEIWAPSAFTASAFREACDLPVVVMPCVVEPTADPGVSREDLGLPEGRHIYLFGFDARSTFGRKNPFGVIEAYRRAFSPRERREEVLLVMKTSSLVGFTEGGWMLRNALAGVGGIGIDRELSPGEMGALTAHCDVYVSLHRTEGFGLGMAEAMSLGRPVIATGYSGNLDYMNSLNSCLVGYKMTQVTEGDLRLNPGARSVYAPNSPWADPDLDDAAHWMRVLFDDRVLAARIGESGALTMRDRYTAAVAGGAMRARLLSASAS